MTEWKECKLGDASFDIIDGDRGKNYPKKDEFFESGYCLFLNTKNVTTNGFEFTELNFITKEKDELLRKGKLKRYDLVLTTRGTVGNVGFYDTNIAFDNIRINSGMVIIRPDGIDEKFNYQLFKFISIMIIIKFLYCFSYKTIQWLVQVRIPFSIYTFSYLCFLEMIVFLFFRQYRFFF